MPQTDRQLAIGRFLTESEVAKWLNVKTRTLQDWRKLKKPHHGLPFHKFGQAVRYLDTDVEGFIAGCRQSADSNSRIIRNKSEIDPADVSLRKHHAKGEQ